MGSANRYLIIFLIIFLYMIPFEKFVLDNGLQVIVHEDPSAQVAVINILYNVGSRDESEERTGFAHLFEHLMFGGSKHIPSYDEALQQVGGENNAFTNPDITNYYLTLPARNLETGFWLESDRMLSLSFDPKVLEVQRNVVIEEFKQRYLNQPYGDAWLKVRPMAYTVHPYKWATIGKEISHIENATMDQVKDFFGRFYIPNNATLVVAGNVRVDEVRKLSEKWFGTIPAGKEYHRDLPREPEQQESRFLEVRMNVPADMIMKVFHMPGRFDNNYYSTDLLSDVMGRGKSSRFYNSLIRDQQLFSSLQAYVMGSVDPGLFVIEGKLNKGVNPEKGDEAINKIIDQMQNERPNDKEIEKVKTQAESTLVFSEVELLNRAFNLAFYNLDGNPEAINSEVEKIRSVTADKIQDMAIRILDRKNSSTLFYLTNLN